MASEEVLLARENLVQTIRAGPALENLIDQQERFAVRNGVVDRLARHGVRRFLLSCAAIASGRGRSCWRPPPNAHFTAIFGNPRVLPRKILPFIFNRERPICKVQLVRRRMRSFS